MDIRLGLVSAYSLLYGVRKPEELLDKAASFGVKTVSISDLNNLYGVHTFLEAAKERGIRPIIGVTLTIPHSSFLIPHYLYCFVENRAGFSRLCEILTIRKKDGDTFNPLPYLAENSCGLVLASADAEVLSALAGRVKRLYAAITPTDIRAVDVGRKLSVPLAFIDNSLFLENGDFAVHRVLRAIGLLKTVGNLKVQDTAEPERILLSSPSIHRKLVSWPEAVKGADEIAAICTFDDLFGGWIFPGYETGGVPVDDELRRRVYEGNAARYGELGDGECGRIEYELGIIQEKGFSSYFLTIDDIVRMASRTCGRGSGAASIVSYGLGITNVDPLRHNLYFERFLNPSRPDPPDLDIDFAWDERDELIKAVIEKFGADYCARVANHNMFRYRSALRETAKAYGFGDACISDMERKLLKLGMRNEELGCRESGVDGMAATISTPRNVAITGKQLGMRSEGFGNEKLGMRNEEFEDSLWGEIFEIATKIEGLPRGLGMHCGGLVITPEPICRYAPIEKSAEGYPLLAWEKREPRRRGLLRLICWAIGVWRLFETL
jgi:DNA polymerase-3 subunit alpha/error-prone DNA polymerase